MPMRHYCYADNSKGTIEMFWDSLNCRPQNENVFGVHSDTVRRRGSLDTECQQCRLNNAAFKVIRIEYVHGVEM